MAIRLRKTKEGWIALCAAETKKEDGDIYIDDTLDHALRIKFKKDYISEGFNIGNCSKGHHVGTAKLKLCPFCARVPKIHQFNERIWTVTCNCGAESPKDSVSKSGAARIWNRRRLGALSRQVDSKDQQVGKKVKK